ncbi:MAG: phenylalanine 4-monooxygenase [Bacteriovoracaceae bacterium]|nr:phenylalanine 4-monooxygenase [Bacteriovoracaceae bacterium]
MKKQHVYVSKPLDSKGEIYWEPDEDKTWSILIKRQNEIVKDRACDEYLEGHKRLALPLNKVPQLNQVNQRLKSLTGWQVQGVPALIQPEVFFNLLANKKFPAATFIRIPEELDYIQEPDIFHEIYGHAPLLTNQTYANFLEEFGRLAMSLSDKDRRRIFRLFWFTVEFGLVSSKKGLRAYGSGILSSIGETQYCLTDKSEKLPLDVLTVLRTSFRIDIIQPLYYYLNTFDDLFHIFDQDVVKLLEESKKLGDLPPKYPAKEKSKEINGVMAC